MFTMIVSDLFENWPYYTGLGWVRKQLPCLQSPWKIVNDLRSWQMAMIIHKFYYFVFDIILNLWFKCFVLISKCVHLILYSVANKSRYKIAFVFKPDSPFSNLGCFPTVSNPFWVAFSNQRSGQYSPATNFSRSSMCFNQRERILRLVYDLRNRNYLWEFWRRLWETLDSP